MEHSLAIILVNWNGYALTRDCIQSLGKTSFPDYKIIVVDNGSVDDSATKLMEEFPNIKLIALPENKGFTGGNNRAMEFAIEAGFRYSLLLNNDTFVEPDFLEPLVNYLDNHTNTGAVQPLICFEYDRNTIWNAGSFFNRFWGTCYTIGYQKKLSAAYTQTKQVDWFTGCAFMVRNEALKKTGLFEEKLFTYYEDVDLSFRLRNQGYDLQFIPTSIVYHIAGMSGKSSVKGKEGFLSPNVHYYNVRNRIWILKKYTQIWDRPSVFLYHVFYFTAMLIYFCVRGRWGKLKACFNGIKDGLILQS